MKKINFYKLKYHNVYRYLSVFKQSYNEDWISQYKIYKDDFKW